MPLPAGIFQAIAALAKLATGLIKIIPQLRIRMLKSRLKRQRRRTRKLKMKKRNDEKTNDPKSK